MNLLYKEEALIYIQSSSFYDCDLKEKYSLFNSAAAFRKCSWANETWSNKTRLIINVSSGPFHLSGSRCSAVSDEWVLPGGHTENLHFIFFRIKDGLRIRLLSILGSGLGNSMVNTL